MHILLGRARDEGPGGESQFYNLEDDPGETKNLWLQHPEIVERLTRRLAEIKG